MGVPAVVVRRAAHGQGAGPTMEAGPNELHMVTDGVAGCGVAVIQVRRFGFPASDGTATTSQAAFYPPLEQIVGQCGKFQLLDRLLAKLFARKHKVLVFSQWTKILDIMDYYFSEKGIGVCRIDGSVKLAERRRQWMRKQIGSEILTFAGVKKGDEVQI
ncbi:hypothetical protein OROHE_011101 [Orobanche hederae]